MGRTLPLNVISPVIAVSFRTGRCESTETIAVAIVIRRTVRLSESRLRADECEYRIFQTRLLQCQVHRRGLSR